MLVLDTDASYASIPAGQQEMFNGFGGNGYPVDPNANNANDNATDILLIQGTNQNDTIKIGETTDSQHLLNIYFPTSVDPNRTFQAACAIPAATRWSSSSASPASTATTTSSSSRRPSATSGPWTSCLTARGTDWVSCIDGGPDNDTLVGTAGRDRIDGGPGSDVIYGMAGDDQLWGDGSNQGLSTDLDVIYGGQGNDDVLGGQGHNRLYAWSMDPAAYGDSLLTYLGFTHGQATAGTTGSQTLTGNISVPAKGQLSQDICFKLALGANTPAYVYLYASATTKNNTPSDLVQSFTTALATAGLAGKVTVGLSANNCLTFSVTGAGLTIQRGTYGIFVNSTGGIHTFSGDLDGNGYLDSDGVSPAYKLEDTGLNRMLGGPQADTLYGGTGLDFLYGNGAPAADPRPALRPQRRPVHRSRRRFGRRRVEELCQEHQPGLVLQWLKP